MTAHLSDGFRHDKDGWVFAVCMCGWDDGPFPGTGEAVDALMEHAAERAAAESGGMARRLYSALRQLWSDVDGLYFPGEEQQRTVEAALATFEEATS